MEPHIALRNTDMLHEIFAHLKFFPPPPGSITSAPLETHAALLNAGLCCKTFSGPALDALWWRLEDIVYLFRILPTFYRSPGSFYVLDGSVSERHWARFNLYAKRVRHLVFTDDLIHPSVYLRLSQLSKLSPLLPNVLSIQSMPRGSGLLCVLSPSLFDVSIFPDDMDEQFPTIWTCLEALVEAAPQLRRLHIQSAALTAACLTSIPRMRNLRDLSLMCRGIRDLRFFHALSRLEHLKSLLVDFDESAAMSASPNAALSISSGFAALDTMTISVTPAKIPSLLNIFQQHHLQRLEIRIPSALVPFNVAPPPPPTPRPDMWIYGLQEIPSKFNFLKHLTLGYQGHRLDMTAPAIFQLFESLLDLRMLETVHLDFPWLLFSDDEFQKIAAAWPELSILRLAGSIGIPNATVTSLQSFAIHCPKLQGLSVPFDARHLPPTVIEDAPISFSRLKTLDTQDSPVESPFLVARHLDRIFPNLKTVQSTRQGGLWSEVGDHLRVLKAVRMDQKARDIVLMKRVRQPIVRPL